MRTAEAGACTERKPPRIRAKVSLYYYSPVSRAPGFVTPVLLLGSSSFSSPAHPRPRVTSAPLPPQQSSVLSPRVLLESLVTHEQRNLDTHLSDDHDEHSVLFSCSWRLSKRNKRKGGKRVGSPSYAFFNSRSASSSSSQERTSEIEPPGRMAVEKLLVRRTGPEQKFFGRRAWSTPPSGGQPRTTPGGFLRARFLRGLLGPRTRAGAQVGPAVRSGSRGLAGPVHGCAWEVR